MKRKNWFWGILFLLLAVLLVIAQFGLLGSFGFWSIFTLGILGLIFIYSLVRLQMFGVTMSLAFIYMVLQSPLKLYTLSPWILIAAGILSGIGLSLIIRPRRRNYTARNVVYAPCSPHSSSYAVEEGPEDENHPYARVRFGEVTKYLHGQQMETCSFDVNFGSLEVYFASSLPVADGCRANINCSFGSVVLYLSPDWQVVDNTSAVLGDTSISSKIHFPPTVATKTLYLTGNVSIGSIEVKYI